MEWSTNTSGDLCYGSVDGDTIAAIIDGEPFSRLTVEWWVDIHHNIVRGKARTKDEIPMIQAMIEQMITTIRQYHEGDIEQ